MEAYGRMTNWIDVETEQLTQGQIDCLLLVHQHLTSKEIAPRLGISPHTVDQRIRTALRILRCNRRSEAAKFVASKQAQKSFFLLQRDFPEPFVEHQAKLAGRRSRESIRLPFATRVHRDNDMSIPLRLTWIVAIAS